ncbi:DUF6875 domain-containing protein [Streptomyces xanthophaeus]|uniref:DUF6875 domain-containing protein n=1 Tax=Streptomyces xanthophaeus TaxID=67385 RepID=UPI0006919B7C|nr:hypothetical protein [Streptomyces xanthophaeus]
MTDRSVAGAPVAFDQAAGSRLRAHEAQIQPMDGVVHEWAARYLCQPHPDLGRSGPVCPYMPTSLALGQFHVASYTSSQGSCSSVLEAVEACRVMLLARSADKAPGHGERRRSALHTTVVLTFPYLRSKPAEGLVEEVQRRAKTRFVRDGLMIGEFHPGPPPAPGLHNPAFRPLASPMPLIALRHMVAGDAPFLRDDPVHADAYRRHFGRCPGAQAVRSTR